MQILWESEDSLKPGEIEERFDWEIDNATLRSVLRVLVERGELVRKQRGRAYYYRPAQKKQRALSTWLSGLAEVFAGGSKAGLIAQLLQDSSLSEEDRAALEKISAGAEPSEKP